MAGISQDTVEEIRSRCDIAELIGSYVQLKHSGSSTYVGLCPFHQEKTPSFHVDGKWQRYHCFGCGKDGDVFRFVMEKDNISFPDAVRQLAQRCGVIIQEDSDGGDPGAAKRNRDLKERLYKVNEEFASFFVRELRNHPSAPAALYLEKRGIPRDVAEKFQIGGAPDAPGACLAYARSLGFDREDLLAAGICGQAEGSGRVYERFSGRLTFAISNEYGRGVGFSARSLEPKPADGRKYVNTPETMVFKKGMLLYGLAQARESVAKKRSIILCEGQMDTIAFHRAGFTNASAPLGTAFTPEQAKLIKRYADEVTLAFDADGAGQKAFLRAVQILLPLSVSIYMIRIPGGKDPDELYSHGGAEAVAEAVNAKVPWLEQLKSQLGTMFDLTQPAGRGKAAGFLAELFDLVGNQVEKESYLQQGAQLLSVSTDALYAELSRLHRKERFSAQNSSPRQGNSPAPEVRQIPERPALTTLVALALSSPDMARRMGEEIPPELLQKDDTAARMLNLLIGAAINGDGEEETKAALNAFLTKHPDPELGRLLIQPVTFADSEKAFADSSREFRRLAGRARYMELIQELRQCGDPARRDEILKVMKEISK